MSTFATTILWLLPVALVCCAVVFYRRLGTNRRSWDRLFSNPDEAADRPESDSMAGGLLRRWLYLAGYRGHAAPSVFVGATLLAAGVGLATVLAARGADLTGRLLAAVEGLPPGIGDLLVPIAYLAPWTVLLILVLLPWMAVRRARRLRVEQIEQDLPISLELLSTLSEAGLGFDAALARVLESVAGVRPLAREFRTYQSDLLAGRTRVDALRRLARRMEVASVSILVSALVQAEQLGSGIALALRRQADDLRDRRRERAAAFAMALPIKRMFPLVICFLPGVFVWTLGPFFVRLFQFAENFIR